MLVANAIATQQGDYTVEVQLVDPKTKENVSFTGLQWTLTDSSGTVINSREDVSVVLTPGTDYETISLGDDDLQILTDESSKRLVQRKLVLEATYLNDAGETENANEVLYFGLENLGL